MPRYIPPSIESIGLKKHLEATKQKHNDYGYDDFVKMRSTKPPVNPVNMARIFTVDVKTIKSWIAIYNRELNDENSRI